MPHSTETRHTIWYDSAGEGEPVLLIMGFTMRGEAWRNQINEFAKTQHVAWFDHAGVGESGPLAVRRLTMRHLALDALGVMDALGWRRAHVVGLSMGGMVAQHVALRAPHRIRTLTLAATHPGGPKFVVPPLQGIGHFASSYRGGPDDRLTALSKLLFSSEFRSEQPERARNFLRADFTAPPPVRVSLAQAAAVATHDTRARLHELARHDTLIIRPGQDLLVDARGSDILAESIGGSRLVRFDESGHAITRQCPERFNSVVLDHISG